MEFMSNSLNMEIVLSESGEVAGKGRIHTVAFQNPYINILLFRIHNLFMIS